MPENAVKPDYEAEADRSRFEDVEARRSTSSQRRMSPTRRAYYFLGLPLLRAVMRLLWWSYRVERVIGEEVAERIATDGRVYAPCYWHQHHVLCTNVIRRWIEKGFRASFLVSASVDGEVPARIARAWGAEVIRGSANQTGALVLRDMREALRRGVSIVTTADGPNGPKYEFKAGAVLMARIAGVPLVPLACAADRAWYLDRWDHFMIPKPFSRVVLAVGEPMPVPADTPLARIEEFRLQMEQSIMSLMAASEETLQRGKGH
ncbi:MAG TPA: lysophospholipid acyltransferase family protein [Woeseiaceae bacterium]|nr:lysophospholipid acyltransferase family protein [Woeseiaceae bacterium]